MPRLVNRFSRDNHNYLLSNMKLILTVLLTTADVDLLITFG